MNFMNGMNKLGTRDFSDDFSGNRYLDSLKIIPFRRNIDNRIEPVTYKPDDFNETDPLVAEIKSHGIELR